MGNLQTPICVQRLQTALHAKVKEEPGRRMEVEMGDLPAPRRHDHDGHGAADRRLRTVADRARDRRLDLDDWRAYSRVHRL